MAVAQHKRSWRAAARALFKPANYSGALKVVRDCSRPLDFLSRYIRNSGDYPAEFKIRTPTGPVRVTAHLPDDLLTINEIFFRGDYADDRNAEVIVDFGSNIGISAVYFLSRNPHAFVYCHEPLPQNISKLKKHLRPFEGRYDIREFAVAEQDGQVEFGWEPTGRYGGIGQEGLETITVGARDSNVILAEIVKRHGRIDLLKIDIEGLEYRLTARIPEDLARSIHVIAAEQRFPDNPLAQTHASSYRRPITTLRHRSS
jgi:FkbM family methyltransferase